MRSILLFVFLLLVLSSPTLAAISINIENPIINNDEITVDITVSGSENSYYLQGMFTAPGTSHYFGWTKNNYGDFYRYIGSPEPELITSSFFKTSPEGDTWSGQITVKNDPDDSDYLGPGEYNLKFRRYTGNSDGPTGDPSNELLINLASIAPTPVPTDTPTTTPTPTKTTTPKPTITPTLPTYTDNTTDEEEEVEDQEYEETDTEDDNSEEPPLVLGESSEPIEEPTPTEEPQDKSNNLPLFLIIPGTLITLASATLLFLKYRKKHL